MHVMEYLEIVLTLGVGSVIIISLLLCYSCVFKQMCCPDRPKKNHPRQTYKRESISMRYFTHVSSQPTETSTV